LEPVVDALGADVEEFKRLWMRARSEEKEGVGSAGGNPYREEVSPSLAAAINLFRQYCARNETEKAKAFLISQIGSRPSEHIELVIELHDRFYYRDEEIFERFDKVIQEFAESGDVRDLERSSSAHTLARRCLERDDAQRALTFARRANLLNPLWYGHFSIHSEALMALGLYTEAEVTATAAYELESKPTLFPHTPLSDVLKITRNYKRLEELTKESYENAGGPGGGEALYYAECLMLCGKIDQAIAILKESLAHEQGEWERIELLISAAKAFCQQGDYSSAKSLLQNDPLYATENKLQLELANVLAREGKRDESFKLLEALHEAPE
jgi:tetratricopeptide (TPR) repeat protein